jgi:hypothetical protein
LYNVREFMGDQQPPIGTTGREPTLTEHNVVSHGVSMSADGVRRLLGGLIGMHPHLRKVIAEARLDKSSSC